MQQSKNTITINRSAKELFDFTIDPKNTHRWVDEIVQEQTNETPTKLGTIYKNQSSDGNWTKFEITDFEQDVMFELTELDDNHHVKYTFIPLDENTCQLEYLVYVDSGTISERFSDSVIQDILQKLKEVVE